jgi:hypothetical protein
MKKPSPDKKKNRHPRKGGAKHKLGIEYGRKLAIKMKMIADLYKKWQKYHKEMKNV